MIGDGRTVGSFGRRALGHSISVYIGDKGGNVEGLDGAPSDEIKASEPLNCSKSEYATQYYARFRRHYRTRKRMQVLATA